MARATQRFIDEVSRSHTVVSYCDVIYPNNEVKRLYVIDGSVTVDRTAQFRRTATLNCIDPLNEFMPEDGAVNGLTPYGTEVRPYRGVRYQDGTEEVFPLGVFRLSSAVFQESGSSSGNSGVRITLQMTDRSRTVSRDKFTNTYSIPAGKNIIDAIKLILARTYPDLEYDSISTTLVTTGPTVYGSSDDPWEAATKLAQSIGCELYFDVNGWVVIAPPTDVDALPAPDFTYIENRKNTMIDLQRGFSDEPGYNGVIVEAQSAADEKAPVRAEAWDNEPSSPTYRLGPYGEVPFITSNDTVKTVADAQKVADSLLKGYIGFASQLDVTAWVNPSLEAGDVVQVERMRMNVTGLYTVDAFTIPLRKEGTQPIKLRQKRTVQ